MEILESISRKRSPAAQVALLLAAMLVGAGCCHMGHPKTGVRLVREDTEWSRAWVTGVNQTNKLHVLLIGDSITEAYSSGVEKNLSDLAYVSRLATSKSLGNPAYLQEVKTVLGNVRFDAIHFNNGMHGVGYTETEYRRDYQKLIRLLQKHAPQAKLIGATTTPKRTANHLDQFDPFNDRIKARNATAQTLLNQAGIPIDDLFALAENHPDYYSNDGTHFNGLGIDAEATQVAGKIRALIERF